MVDRVTTAVVEDVGRDGAFDEVGRQTPAPLPKRPPIHTMLTHIQVLKSADPGFDYVIHTASPYQLGWDDAVKECLDPAIKGTTGLLKSIHAHAPTVRRVVMTSSSAAILQSKNHPKVYDESFWSDVTWEEATGNPERAYVASKVRHPPPDPAAFLCV